MSGSLPPKWNGLLCVNKEAGYTSNDVVAKLRGILKQRKIGHTGTLDPEAVGLLVVCLGSATRVTELLTDHDKEYLAEVQLGVVTDTQDMTGAILERRGFDGITGAAVAEAVRAFRGTYDQIPPMYSAIKVDGKRLYRLAREGKTVERKARPVTIHAISILDDSHLLTEGRFTMEVRCSKGTYIRTLCEDIGARLGTGAAMRHLLRTGVGSFRVEQALTLSQIEAARDDGSLIEHILSVEEIFRDLDRIEVISQSFHRLKNGNPFIPSEILPDLPEGEDDALSEEERFQEGDLVRVYCDGAFFGIYKYSAKLKQFRVEKYFYHPLSGAPEA